MRRPKRCNPPDLTKKIRKQFLEILREGWSETHAKRALKIPNVRYDDYKRWTPSWQKAVDDTKAAVIAVLEDEVHRRGVKGVLEPMVSGGKIVVHKRVYSDRLLAMSVKAKSPTYAALQSNGSNFELAFSNAAEELLSRLTTLVEVANRTEQAIFDEVRKASSA